MILTNEQDETIKVLALTSIFSSFGEHGLDFLPVQDYLSHNYDRVFNSIVIDNIIPQDAPLIQEHLSSLPVKSLGKLLKSMYGNCEATWEMFCDDRMDEIHDALYKIIKDL